MDAVRGNGRALGGGGEMLRSLIRLAVPGGDEVELVDGCAYWTEPDAGRVMMQLVE